VKKIEPASSAASLMMLESGNGSRFELSRRGGERFNKRRGAVEDWEISHDKIVFKEPIGCGSFGTVYKAYYFGDDSNQSLNCNNLSDLFLFLETIELFCLEDSCNHLVYF
jgi:hypothetical protein